ncbi:MAG: diacylglycerol/polyprenol kinase family protein [Nitrososphaeria archaeon]
MTAAKATLIFLAVSCLSLVVLVPAELLGVISGNTLAFLGVLGACTLCLALPLSVSHGMILAYYGRMFFHTVGGVFLCLFSYVCGKEASTTLSLSLLLVFAVFSLLDWLGVETALTSPNVDSAGRRVSGATHYLSGTYWLISVLVVLLFFPPSIAYASILILSVGDTAAGLSKRIGHVPNPFNRERSVESWLVQFFGSFSSCLLYVHPLVALVGSAVGSLVESLRVPVDDNLSVPLCSALVMSFMSFGFS